jgi:dihydrolipoamide dehydrogenase
MSNTKKDLVVIGGGPAGYISAIKAARLGASVLLVEKQNVGGTCLNRGCIPTKHYVQSVHTISVLTDAASRGITVSDPSFKIEMKKAVKEKDKTVKRLVKGVEFLLKKANVTTINQEATIVDKNLVKLEDGSLIEAKNILIASGSSSATLPIEGVDSPLVIDSEQILDIEKVPDKLVIIGGGVIGIEFASIFSTFGSKVTLIEALPSILNNFDEDQIEVIEKRLKKDKVSIFADTLVTKIETKKDKAILSLNNGEILEATLVLVAAGRKANLSPLTNQFPIKTIKNAIDRNEYGQTNVDNIYAAGDVTALNMLAHAAYHMGEVVTNNICVDLGLIENSKQKINLDIVPSVVYSDLEVASIGITEKEASKKYDTVVGKFPLSANGRALTAGYSEGFVKIVSERKYGQILGVFCVGLNVSEIINEATVAMQHELTVHELANTIFAHPTISEALKEAAAICIGECYHWGN